MGVAANSVDLLMSSINNNVFRALVSLGVGCPFMSCGGPTIGSYGVVYAIWNSFFPQVISCIQMALMGGAVVVLAVLAPTEERPYEKRIIPITAKVKRGLRRNKRGVPSRHERS